MVDKPNFTIQFCHAIVCQRNRPNLSSGLVVGFVSNVLCSKLQGGMKVYICQHDTAPPGLFSSSNWPALSTDMGGCGFLLLVFICDLCFSWLPLFSFQMNS